MDEGVFGADQVDGASDRNLNCDQVPISISSLAEMDTHKEDRPYKCNQCDKSYRHAGSLVNHKKTHQIGLYSCLICQKEYSNPMGLKSHLRTHSEEKRFQCDQCGEAFRMSQQLYNHRKSLHSFCSMSNGENLSSQKYEVQSPVLMENSNLMSNLENYIAESMVPVDFSQLVLKYYPEEKSQDEGTAKEDVEGTRTLIEERDELFNTNTDEYRYKCNQCGKAYKHAGSLANHKQSHMVGVYQCAICYKEFSNLMAMKNHCRLHSDSRARRSFKTPRSSAKVAGTPTGSADIPQTDVLESADLMEKHEEPPNIAEVTENNNIEHDVEKIPLPDLHHQVELGPDSLSPLSKPNHDVTDTTFCLDSMLQSSSNESMVELQENKIAHNPSVKIKHETGQCHAQQQQYDATYEEEANSGDLENRPFKCQECGKSYRHAGSLINHKKTHQTGVYNCSLCSKQMFNMAALKNHLRAHFKSRAGRKLEDAYFHSANFSELFQNPEDPYQCGICGEMLTNESDFLQHQALHQKEEAKDTSCEDQHMEEVPESDICWQEHPQASHGSSDDSAYSSGPGMPDTIKTEVENLPLQQWSQEESLAITPEIKTENSGPVLQNASTGFEQLPDDQIVAKEEESCGLKDQPPIDRPYKCESCERTYRHKSSLINHKLTHKIGVYQCSICPKQYTNLMALRNHLRFHSRSYAGRRGLTSRLSHHFFRGKPRFLQNKSMHSVVESVKLNDKISPRADIDVAGAEASLKESQIHCRCGKSFNCSGDFQTHSQICHNAMPVSYAELPADLHGEVSTLTDAREVVSKTKELTEPQGNVQEASEHQGRRVYECDLCEKSYRHSGSLINHKRTHQTGDYMCPYCSKHIHNLAALKNHIRIHHKIKKSQLGQESDNSRFLFSDMCFPHEGKDMFGCVSCEETFHSEDDLVAHQMVHMALEEDLWDHQAPECSTPNHNKDDTLRDIRDYEWEHSSISNFHGDEIKDLGSAGEDIKPVDYTCVECGEVYESVDDLNNHKHTHQTGIYQCSFCPKEYPNLLALRSHFQSHTKPQALRNSGRKTLDGSEGNEFMDNQPSVDNRYDCGHCGLIFSNEVDFHQHQVAHEKQVMDESLPGLHAEGQESELSFPMHSSERELLRRIKSEMEETDPSEIADGGSLLSHICGFCGKTYDDLESLKVHSLSHTAEEVPFANENDHPDTDFKDKSLQQSLKEEERSGETAKNEGSPESRPYTCEQCGKTYRHGGSLVNHKKTHLVGNFQCVACSRQYPNLAAYRNHLRHHPDCKQQAALNGSHELQASNLNDTIFPCGDGVQLNSCPPSSITLSDLSSFHVLSTDLKPSRDSESKLNSHLHSSPPQIQCQSPVKHVKSASKRSSRRAGRRSKTVNSQPTDPRSTSVSVSLSMSDVEDKSVQICEFCGKMFFGVKDLALHLSGNCDRSNHSEKARSSLVEQRTEGKDDLLPSLSGLIQSQNQGETGFHQRPFRCEVCGRSYRHAGSLINHKQTHKTGIFRCSICQKRFFNLMAMKNHNRIHFELKRHKCLDCGKAFRLHKQLDTHQRIHRQRAAARKPGRRNRRSMKYRKVVQWQQQKSSINVSNQRSSEDTSVDQGNGGVKKNAGATVKSAMDPNFRPYQCEECGRSYRHAGSLFNHKKSHKMGQYCCSICDKTYSNLMAMKNHQRTHYEAKRHHCSLCGKTFRWKRQLFRHQLAHVQEGSQSGSPLPSGAEEASLVDGHQAESSSVSCEKSRITSKHTSSNVKESKLSNDLFSSLKPVCQACGNLFTSYDELENHSCKESRTDMVASGNEGAGDPTSSQEEDGRPYQCNVCGRTYRHAGSLLNHKNTHETGLYKCSICHKQFSNPMAIKNHLRTHTAERRFQCTDCGKAFRSSRELICHNRVHTGEKPFHCPTCNRGFSRKLTLRHHQRTHKQLTFSSQSSSLVLPTDKETESNENNTSESSEELQNQVAPTTKDERKYKCNQCERSYRHAGSLFNHQKTHRTGVYKCPNCLKEYFNLLAFKNHLRIHKYPCKDCGRAFRISSHLAAHRKIHEQEGPLSCLLCNKHFFCRSSFEQHQLTHNSPSSDALEPQAVANFMVEVT
ncbi:zinc finger protein 646 [Mixophyes fleayi]|uniref:zinc finger protein 646 n=1 Tax=Mixophyes fleayi TaxID=3061075 RepID=UPI003F4D7F4A